MALHLGAIRGHLWVAVIAAAYLFIFVRVQWRIGDEGDMLNGALAVAEGRVPYRDFFDLRGPACFYWLGFFFKMFGATWQVARLHLLLTGTLTSVLVYHLARRVCGTTEAVLTCAIVTAVSIPFWPASHHHWDSNLFALATVAAFVRWQDHRSSRWLLATGILAGLTSCFIYQKGFYLLVAFLAVLVVSRLYFKRPIHLPRCVCTMLAGYGAVGLAVLAWFFYIDAIPDFYNATIRFPLDTYADANRLPYAHHLMLHSLVGLDPWRGGLPWVRMLAALLLMAPVALIAALPFLVVYLAAVCAITRPAARWLGLPVVTYGLTGSALWLSEIHRPDVMHLIYGCPLLLITLWLLWDIFSQRRPVRVLVHSLVAVPLLFLAVSKGVRAAAADHKVVTRRGAIVMPRDDQALRFLLSDRVKAGDYVLVYPYYSTYYFLANVRNPTRFGQMMYGPGSKPYFDEAIAAMDARRVEYILWDSVVEGENLKEWFPAYQHPPEHERWMELYFKAHYHQIGVLNEFRILRRRDRGSDASANP